MGFMDYIPHRWALNKSLRKEADKLKSKLASYQIEYERRLKECQAEIDKAQLEKDADLERIKKSLEQELQQDQEMHEALLNDLVDYAATFLQRKFLYSLKDNKKAKANIVDEDIKFLKAQMEEIRVEIDHIQQRKSALSAFTNVQDIIALSNDCGYELSFSSDDDADSMLKKINVAIDNCSDDRIMRVSLFRLRGIIYERSEYLSTIKYIEWVIQQKIEYSKQLNEKKQSLSTQFKGIKTNIKKIDYEIKSLNQEIEAKAEHIRFSWTKPIVYLSAEIDYLYLKKQVLKDLKKESKDFASMHLSDQEEWDRISNSINEIKNELGDTNDITTKIQYKKREKKSWYGKKNHICSILAENKVRLITNKRIADSDEQRIITSRLAEIEQIRIKGVAEAERICQQEKDKLISEYTTQRDAYLKKSEELSDKLKEKEESIKAQQLLLSGIREEIKNIKENDSRFFFVKWFSDPPGLTDAKENEATQSDILLQLKETQKTLNKQVSALRYKIKDLSKKHETALNRCQPKPLRPTSDEKHEEKILKLRKKIIMEKKNGNKN